MKLSNRATRRRLLFSLAATIASVPAATLPAAAGQTKTQGAAVFAAKCSACHTVGGGRLVGPDLEGVTARRERSWLVRFIREPERLLAAGDPTATELLKQFNNVPMPNMGLAEADVDAVVAYLGAAGASAATGAGAGSPRAPEAAPAAAEGAAVAGGKLFAGSISLQRRGPPCVACHSVTGRGTLGGGTLGPDLTDVSRRFGTAGLAGTLKALPFPRMRAVYSRRPLTDKERADLLAFFAQAAGQGAATEVAGGGFLAAGLGIFIALAALPQVLWRNRFNGVRQRLAGGSR